VRCVDIASHGSIVARANRRAALHARSIIGLLPPGLEAFVLLEEDVLSALEVSDDLVQLSLLVDERVVLHLPVGLLLFKVEEHFVAASIGLFQPALSIPKLSLERLLVLQKLRLEICDFLLLLLASHHEFVLEDQLILSELVELGLQAHLLAVSLSLGEVESLVELLVFFVESLDLPLKFILKSLVRVMHLFDLVLELGFEGLSHVGLAALKFVLGREPSLLELLQGLLEAALGVIEVSLVLVLLLLEELELSLPEGLVLLMLRVSLHQLSIELLDLLLELQNSLSLSIAVVHGLASTIVQVVDLALQVGDLLTQLLLDLPLLLLEASVALVASHKIGSEVLSFLMKPGFKFFDSVLPAFAFLLPQLLLRLDSLQL